MQLHLECNCILIVKMTTQVAEEILLLGALSLDRESDCGGEIAQSVQLPRSVELRRKCNQSC